MHGNISVIHKKNGGVSSARNAGLDYIKNTDYVLFLDSDDTLDKNAIAGLVRKAMDTGADIIYPDRCKKIWEATGSESIAILFPENMHEKNPKLFGKNVLIKEGRAWRAHSVLYKYELIVNSNARFPVGHIAEDISFNLQVLACANKIDFYPYPVENYLKRSGSITMTYQKNFENDIWYIDEQAKKFLHQINVPSEESEYYADTLLCRNIVTYLFSIMSKKNKMLSKQEKISKAYSLIDSENSRNVIYKKIKAPWFEKRLVGIAYNVVYFLLRHRKEKLAMWIMSLQ